MGKLINEFPTFPRKSVSDDSIVDQMLGFMKWWGISKRELDDLTIPEYLIMRDYAVKEIMKEKREYDKIKRKR